MDPDKELLEGSYYFDRFGTVHIARRYSIGPFCGKGFNDEHEKIENPDPDTVCKKCRESHDNLVAFLNDPDNDKEVIL